MPGPYGPLNRRSNLRPVENDLLVSSRTLRLALSTGIFWDLFDFESFVIDAESYCSEDMHHQFYRILVGDDGHAYEFTIEVAERPYCTYLLRMSPWGPMSTMRNTLFWA